MKILPYKFKTKQSNKLIIIFQSFNKELYEPENIDHFELENSFEKYDLNCDLLFIKDIKRGLWYLSDVEQTTKDLQNIISTYQKVMCTGISAGGFASILYGSLLKVDLVVAVNPQTSLLDFETNNFIPSKWPANSLEYTKWCDTKQHINSSTDYYLNGWQHSTHITGFNVIKEDKTYSSMTDAQKLHDIKQFEHLSNFNNVYWLDFMTLGYKDGQFIRLIEKYGFE